MEAAPLTESGNGGLMETLRVYLDSDLDVTRAAEALYVHPNTVRYRLRRIGELTGSTHSGSQARSSCSPSRACRNPRSIDSRADARYSGPCHPH
jgi:PucR C-terminal helix-turn-helix domain